MKLEVTSTDKTVSSIESSTKPDSAAGESNSGERSTDETKSNPGVRETSPKTKAKARTREPKKLRPNRVRQCRIESMMSKAELARRANLSVLTIDRLEKGFGCRMHTKRKILEALGLSLADRVRVFGEEEE
jgi:DNA-binding XRE family transcriptional regulator